MLIVITGQAGTGKTAVCEETIKLLRARCLTCGGIITYQAPNRDIIIEEIQTGQRQTLASTSSAYAGPRAGDYFFNPEAIRFGKQAIEHGTLDDVLIVDEIGHLELKDEGFNNALDALDRSGKGIVVIPRELLSAYRFRLGQPKVFDVTPENRDKLPGAIAALFTAK